MGTIKLEVSHGTVGSIEALERFIARGRLTRLGISIGGTHECDTLYIRNRLIGYLVQRNRMFYTKPNIMAPSRI